MFSWQPNLFLSRKIVRQRERLEAYSCLPARESLDYFLRELIIQQEDEELQTIAEFYAPFNNQDLAEIIAVTPEHLFRLLKKIEKGAIIGAIKAC